MSHHIAAIIAFIIGFILGWTGYSLRRAFRRRGHRPPYRENEERNLRPVPNPPQPPQIKDAKCRNK
jgi:hypothetical protein